MNHLKISTRLTLLIGLLSLLLTGIGFIGLFGIVKSNDALQSVYEDRSVSMGQMAEIQRQLLRKRLAIATALVTPSPEIISANTTEEAQISGKFAQHRSRFEQEGLLAAAGAFRANDLDATASSLKTQAQGLVGRVSVFKLLPHNTPRIKASGFRPLLIEGGAQ